MFVSNAAFLVFLLLIVAAINEKRSVDNFR